MEKEDLGKEIYGVERSKAFGHIRDYLSYAMCLFLVFVGIYANDFKGMTLVMISLVVFLLISQK